MVQRGGGARFLLESLEAIHISRKCDRQHFDRDVASQPRVARSVDLAHAAAADQTLDDIRAKPCAALKGVGRDDATERRR
jgi:hypothetical protein